MASMPATKKAKAYIIGGHGEERNGETFIVPPGSIIVVKAYAGSVTKAYGLLEKGLCSLTPDLLKDPIAHYEDLTRVLGSLAIYEPGDSCPLFYYNLLSCYELSRVHTPKCDSFGSGVMDIDLIYADDTHLQCMRTTPSSNRSNNNARALRNVYQSTNIDHNSVYDFIYPYLSKLYQHSILPTTTEIEGFIHEAIDMINENNENNITIFTILDYIQNIVNITQETLCGLYPGVYYHIICRDTPVGKSLFEYNINNRTFHIPSRVTFASSTPETQHLLRQHISEAELHRKGHIKAMYERRYANQHTNSLPLISHKVSRSKKRRQRRQKRHNQTKKSHL
jgi:hypothetical protein